MQPNVLYTFENSFSMAVNQVLLGLVGFLPNLLGAVALFMIGWLVADIVKSGVAKVVNLTKLGELFKNPAIQDFLKNAQVSQKIEDIIGEIVRWLCIILFFVASINILGITSINLFLNGIISGIPTLIAAVITLVVGVIVAGFMEKMVKGSLGSTDPSMSRLAGKVVSYSIMTFFVLSALSQLGIASFFINTVFIGFIIAIALSLGIGFGLGSKDIIKKILEDWYKKIEK